MLFRPAYKYAVHKSVKVKNEKNLCSMNLSKTIYNKECVAQCLTELYQENNVYFVSIYIGRMTYDPGTIKIVGCILSRVLPAYMHSLLSWYYRRMSYIPVLFVRVLLFPNYSYIYIIAYLCVYLSF